MKTLPELFTHVANQNPDNIAIVEGESEISYHRLQNEIRSFTDALRSKEVRSGDRIALLLPNSSAFVISYFGVLRIGESWCR